MEITLNGCFDNFDKKLPPNIYLFKVNNRNTRKGLKYVHSLHNKNTRTTSQLPMNIFHNFYTVSIFDFEQVNAG